MKNKDRIQILEHKLNIHSDLLERLISKVGIIDEPEIKQLDQSIFDGLDSKWLFAAIDGCTGRACVYEYKPHLSHGKDYWRIDEGLQRVVGGGYDTTNWESSLIEREPEPKLKQLDQSVFNGLDEKWVFAATDKDGDVWVYADKPYIDKSYWYVDDFDGKTIGEGYDASNWKTSLIERETNELTGSELCEAMLARGDKYVMCLVSDDSEEDTLLGTYSAVISSMTCGDSFYGYNYTWLYATPINNQGDPLTSKDVGL